MRAFLSGIAALAFAALSACNNATSGALGPVDVDPAAVEAMAAKLVSDPFKGDGKAAANLDALRASLPKEIAISWGNLSFDAATGATVVKDMKLTPAEHTDVGISISELRLWDFDVEAAKARLAGQRTTETIKLARRIDAKGMAAFGLASFFNQIVASSPGMNGPVAAEPDSTAGQPATPGWPSATDPEFQFAGQVKPNVTKADMTYGRIVLDDIVLRAVPPAPKGTPAPGATAMPESMQGYMNIMRSLGVDAMAMNDLKLDLGMTIDGQPITMTGAMKSGGTRGWRGSDSDASFVRDLSFNIAIAEGGAVPAGSFDVSYGLMTSEDFRFEKFQDYALAGITPPMTETDIMSLGRFHSQNGAWKLNGKTLVSIGDSVIDARGFHWMMPTNISAKGSNITVDIGAMMELAAPAADYFTTMAGEIAELQRTPADPTASAPTQPAAPAGPKPSEIISQVAAAFAKNGMSKPNLSYDVAYTWNPGNGDARVNFGVGTDTFMKIDGSYEMGLPSFKEMADLQAKTPAAPTDPLALANLFEKRSSLKGLEFNVDDKGGLEKLYSLLADLSVSMGPSLMGDMAPPGGMTAANLRMLAGTMVMALGASPELSPLFAPVGQFLSTGGKLHLEMKPAKPVPLAEAGMAFAGPAGPGAAIKQLGVKAEHTPAKK